MLHQIEGKEGRHSQDKKCNCKFMALISLNHQSTFKLKKSSIIQITILQGKQVFIRKLCQLSTNKISMIDGIRYVSWLVIYETF